MRIFVLTSCALSLLTSGTALADAVQVGTAHRAPAFAQPSNVSARVVDIGTASRAPLYAVTSGNGPMIVKVGSASHAPTYARG